MPTDYQYRKTGKFNSDLPKRFDLKRGCLLPLLVVIIVIGLIVGLSILFGNQY